MPVYEYACNACGAAVSVFVRSFSAEVSAKCERCGSDDLRRLISRVSIPRARGDESLDDLSGLDESDPRAMAAWARRMRDEMGDDAGPEFDEVIDRLERGESLDDEGFGGDDYDDDF